MGKTYTQIKVAYPNEGVVRSAQLSDTVAPEDSVQIAVNFTFDRIGSLTSRKGITQFAPAPAGGPIISLGKYAQNASTVRRVLAQIGNTIYAWNGTTWTSVRTLANTNKARYSQFLNLTYMCNGATGDNIATYDGTTFGTTNVGSLPKLDFINAGFEGRIWGADAALDRVYHTDVVTTGGVITGGTDYIEKLSPQDGDQITALWRAPRALLVFKYNHIYRIYGATSVDPYPAYNVGTFSQESIIEAKDGIYFHHSSGFYKFMYDGQPQEISRRISDFVKAIPRANYEKISGIWDGQDAVTWFIGDVTVEGARYKNCAVRYTISTQVWTIYDYTGADNNATATVLYADGTIITPLAGMVSGKVCNLEDGKTDLGENIYVEMITRWISFTDSFMSVKEITGFGVHHENGAGLTLQYQIDKDVPDKWEDIGTLDEEYVTMFPNDGTDNFNRIRFRIKGVSSGVPVIINGIEILTLKEEGFNYN